MCTIMYLFIQGLKSAGIWLLLHTATSEKLQKAYWHFKADCTLIYVIFWQNPYLFVKCTPSSSPLIP